MKDITDAHWRERIPSPHAPRHPLWLDAYFAAWELLAQAARPQGPEACLLALCLRYTGDGATWLDRCEAADPLLAWCEWECYQYSGDAARLAGSRARLRSRVGALARVLPGLVERFEERTAQAGLADNAYEALAVECSARIARTLGDEALAARFEQAWRACCQALNAQAWAEPPGFYVDGAGHKTSAGFLPLLAGAASEAQADRLVQHLTCPDEFWRLHVAPSLSADQPRYADRGAARRGSVYPQDNYAIVKGLERYGRDALALRVADNHLTTVSHVFKETRALWDNYAPDYIEPGSIAHPDEPLAALSAIALLLETIFGLTVDAPQNALHWRPRLRETHGVEGLRVGGTLVSAQVVEHSGQLTARLTTSAPLRLHLSGAHGDEWVDVPQTFQMSLA